MTSPDDDNPTTAKKAIYHIIIEAPDVEDTEFQAEEVSEITNEIAGLLSFNATVWLEEVEYET